MEPLKHSRPSVLRRRPRRRALATVEMAMVLPLLLTATFAVCEYGLMFFKYQEVTNIARQAARLGATPNASDATVQARVDQLLTQAKMQGKGATVTISPSVNGLTPTQPFTVTLSIPYANISPLHFTDKSHIVYIPAPDNLSASITMTKEGP